MIPFFSFFSHQGFYLNLAVRDDFCKFLLGNGNFFQNNLENVEMGG